MSGVFQPTVPLYLAVFRACDALCVMAGTERPILDVDPDWQVQKKGCAAVVALQLAGVPTSAVIAAIQARLGTLEGAKYILAAANASLPNAVVVGNSPTIQFATTGGNLKASAIGDALKFNILSAGTQLASTQATVVFSNSNGISFGMSNNRITASHNALTSQSVQTQGLVSIQGSSGAIIFSNSNNVVFGFNASTITASAAFTDAGVAISGGASSQGSGTVIFSASNGIGFGLSAGTMTASHNGLTSQSAQAFSASGGSSAFQTLNFRNANGFTFSNSGGSVEGSYTVPAQSTQPVAAAGSNGSFLFSTLLFSNANGASFLTSAGPAIALSYTVPTVTNSSWTVSDAATSGTVGRLAFTNLNGVTLSLSSGTGGLHTVVGSHNGLTSQSNQAFSAAGGESAFQTLSFANSFGVSFSNSNGSLVGSIATTYAGTGFTSTTTTGTVIVGTNNTAGLSLGVPAFLTTAMASNRGSDFLQATAAFAGTNASGTINSTGISVSVGNYITTARASTDAIGLNSALTANGVSMTANSSGLSLNFPAFLTTAMASNRGSDFVAATAAFAGTNASGTINSTGISVAIGNYITTAMASNRASDFVAATAVFNGTNASGTMASNSWSVSVAAQTAQTQSNVQGIIVSNTTYRTGDVSFSNLNGITFGSNGANVVTASHNGLTTARASTDAIGLNTAQTNVTWTANSSGLSINAAGYAGTTTGFTGANISASMTHNSLGLAMSLSAAAAGGGVTNSDFFEPFAWQEIASTSSSASLSQLHLQPFLLPVAYSFNQINFIASVPIVNTGVVGTWSFRLTSTSSMAYEAYYTLSNTNFVDLFIFSRGTGGFSSELETLVSTRNSFITLQSVTFGATANHTAGSTGSMSARQSHSMSVSYPEITSGTTTSVNAASTVTTWGMGYTTWNSTASTSVSNTYNTTTTGSTSIASTMPGTTAWASYKLLNMNFATSLGPGVYWLGMVRYSSTSSSSAQSSTNAAAGTGASWTTTFGASGLTMNQNITWAGGTNSVSLSLGRLSAGAAATMAPSPGQGSFSGTWASNTTYLNNAGNPAGAVALTQINSAASNFVSWVQLASNRI